MYLGLVKKPIGLVVFCFTDIDMVSAPPYLNIVVIITLLKLLWSVLVIRPIMYQLYNFNVMKVIYTLC